MLIPFSIPGVQTFFLGRGEAEAIGRFLPVASTLIKLRQEHTDTILDLVDEESLSPANLNQPADAAITALPLTTLTLRIADCLPVLIYHPSGIIAAVHAGRKGTELHILQKTLEKLQQTWHVESGFTIWFGPAICNNCYQIHQETNEHFDLIAENAAQLTEVLRPDAFTLIKTNDCTLENPDTYYSYRHDGTAERNIAGITLV